MTLEELVAIIDETIEETKEDLLKAEKVFASVTTIALQVMTALQRAGMKLETTRSLTEGIESDIAEKAIAKAVSVLNTNSKKMNN